MAEQLTPEQYAVTRRKGTEAPFTGALYNQHDQGTYRCVCCGEPLFSSDAKFESGSGWPSFWEPIEADQVATETDPATDGARRGPLPPLRGASRACLPRRTETDRAAFLHQFGGARFQEALIGLSRRDRRPGRSTSRHAAGPPVWSSGRKAFARLPGRRWPDASSSATVTVPPLLALRRTSRLSLHGFLFAQENVQGVHRQY